MSVNSSRPSTAAHSVVIPLLPIIAVVFIAFLVIGLALPVLPLHVHEGLGLGAFVVGLVAGAQFGASLFSRFWAGHFADSRGAKRATVTGLLVATAAGLLYLLSLLFIKQPMTSVTILLLGRAVLGGAESFIVTGAFTWGLVLSVAGLRPDGRLVLTGLGTPNARPQQPNHHALNDQI
jgi:MFS family permease